MTQDLVLATRGSALALWQAEFVKEFLAQKQFDCRIQIIKTTGDRVQDRFLYEMGGKGLFVKELEEALLAGHCDIAVHSLKDLPAKTPEPFELACVLARHPAGDLLVFSHAARDLLPESLRQKSVWTKDDVATLPAMSIATGSLRRKALLLSANAELDILPIRGNVDTRLSKLGTQQLSALVLAEASLYRLAIGEEYFQVRLDPHWFVPSSSQGALGIECLKGSAVSQRLRAWTCARSERSISIERHCLHLLGGDCTLPIGAHAYMSESSALVCSIVVLSADGKKEIRAQHNFSTENEDLSNCQSLVQKLYDLGVKEILDGL